VLKSPLRVVDHAGVNAPDTIDLDLVCDACGGDDKPFISYPDLGAKRCARHLIVLVGDPGSAHRPARRLEPQLA
jgi:hypothetical protein